MARPALLPPHPKRLRPDVSLAIVNIVLLLILFFLATGAIVDTPSHGVEAPETLDLPIDRLPSPVLVIDAGGLLLDGAPTSAELLVQALEGQEVLHVLIAGSAPALDLLDVLDQPGLDRLDIRLVTVHRQDAP